MERGVIHNWLIVNLVSYILCIDNIVKSRKYIFFFQSLKYWFLIYNKSKNV